MKKLKLIVSLLMILVFITGCSSGSSVFDEPTNGPNDSPSNKMVNVGIDNADSLFITPGSSIASQSKIMGSNNDDIQDSNRLFKITDDGYIQEVTYYNEKGEEIEVIENQPTAVYNAGKDYVFVGFGSDESNINEGYLVSKANGSVYDISDAGFPIKPTNRFRNEEIIQEDDDGNLYYITDIGSGYSGLVIKGVVKLNSTNMTGTMITPEDHAVDYFTVDGYGNVAYHARDDNSPHDRIQRIVKTDGGMEFLESREFWLGLDNKINYINDDKEIIKVKFDESNNLEEEKYGLMPDSFYNFGFDELIIKLEDRIIITRSSSGKVFEVYNNSGEPREIDLGYSEITQVGSSNNFYYVYGDNGKLSKVNPENDSMTNIFDGEFDIYKLQVSSNDIITFNAYRMEDGATVLGKVNNNAELNIINDTLNQEVISLERIK